MKHRVSPSLIVVSFALAVFGCGTDDTGGGDETGGVGATGGASTGGASATGGMVSTGGVVSTGGAVTTGGAVSTGGVTATGGIEATGGLAATGGMENTGGMVMGGAPVTGGADASGGASTGGESTGGESTGGVSTGGVSTGGVSTGGSVGEGGTGGGSGGFNPCPTTGEPCKILPFGDSITNGVGSSDQGGYRSPLFGLAVAANQQIVFTGSQVGGPSEVSGVAFPRNHEGRSGWTIEDGYVSYGEGIIDLVPSPAFDEMPHIVLLMIGTNDINADTGQADMPNRLDGLLDKIVETAPNALIVVAQLTPIRWNPQSLTDYNAAIPGIVDAHVADGHHMTYVDMSQMPDTSLGSDGLHPNDEGYVYMANVWHAAIAEFLPN